MYKCETHGCDKQQVVHAGGKTTYECQECERERVRAFTRGFDKPAATGSGEPISDSHPRCGICGEPMPAGEEMFNYHGYSGPCPKPPLKPTPPASQPTVTREDIRQRLSAQPFLWKGTDDTWFERNEERLIDFALALLRAAEQK